MHDRLIKLDGPVNFRDLGGYAGQTNQQVKWGKIYRSDSLSSLSLIDRQKLHHRKIVVDVDLRSTFEQNTSPDAHWLGVKFVDAHVYPEDASGHLSSNTDAQIPADLLEKVPKLDTYLGSIYQNVLLNPHSQQAFRQVFQNLLSLSEREALVYHCSAGKDRTGVLSAVILMGLGVDDETIAKDYLLTNSVYSFTYDHASPSQTEIEAMVNQMNTKIGEAPAIKSVPATIRAVWGSFDEYFVSALGFSKQDLADFRTNFLEKKD